MLKTLIICAELIFIFLVPVFIIWLTKKSKFFKAIGPIILCYVVGMLLALTNLQYDKQLSNTIAEAMVPIALPLILFNFSLSGVKKLAKSTAISYALVCVSVMIVAVLAFFVVGTLVPDSSKLSAMAVGLYTGGTPNLLAIGNALQLDSEYIAAANTSDIFVGGLYLLFLYSVAGKVYSAILDKRSKKCKTQTLLTDDTNTDKPTETDIAIKTIDTAQKENKLGANEQVEADFVTEEYDYSALKGKNRWKVLLNLLFAVLCLGLGVLISWIDMTLRGEGQIFNGLIIILTVSVMGIALSFVKPIREVRGSYQVGQYFILVFSLALAMSLDLHKLAQDMLPTLIYYACIQTAAILLHLILCRLFRIDSATALITSVAGIYGPPFIAPVAQTTKMQHMIVPGVICGAVGLAIGNFLGIGIGELLLLFG